MPNQTDQKKLPFKQIAITIFAIMLVWMTLQLFQDNPAVQTVKFRQVATSQRSSNQRYSSTNCAFSSGIFADPLFAAQILFRFRSERQKSPHLASSPILDFALAANDRKAECHRSIQSWV
ncbi:MAG: hypothetical protein ACSHW1_03150 [Yoonia sp.]|uniref:hypothetical protein n=1 Tax=Yoonia sp. TaxID=2212373 RepID=UPI003EF750C9